MRQDEQDFLRDLQDSGLTILTAMKDAWENLLAGVVLALGFSGLAWGAIWLVLTYSEGVNAVAVERGW